MVSYGDIISLQTTWHSTFVYKLFNIYKFPGSVSWSVSTLLGKVVKLRQRLLGSRQTQHTTSLLRTHTQSKVSNQGKKRVSRFTHKSDIYFARLANTLLKDEESACDNHVFACSTCACSLTLPNIYRLKNSTHILRNKPFLICSLTTLPHLRYVATLPCNCR